MLITIPDDTAIAVESTKATICIIWKVELKKGEKNNIHQIKRRSKISYIEIELNM